MLKWLRSKKSAPPAPEKQATRHYVATALQQKKGEAAEAIAAQYLIQQGLTLIERNVAFNQGEIDLIMQAGNTLVFIEVRWRKTTAFGGALCSITPSKLRKLSTACEMYLQNHPKWRNHDCRIDAILLQGSLESPQIEWLTNITG